MSLESHPLQWSIFNGSCADKCTVCFACNKIGFFYWDNDHFVSVPSFPVSGLNVVGKVIGGFRVLHWTCNCDLSLISMGVTDKATCLAQPVWPSDPRMAYFQLRCTHY
jgi:hypothetical protein